MISLHRLEAQLSELDHIAGSIHEGAEDFLAKPYKPTIVRARVAVVRGLDRLNERGQLARNHVEPSG